MCLRQFQVAAHGDLRCVCVTLADGLEHGFVALEHRTDTLPQGLDPALAKQFSQRGKHDLKHAVAGRFYQEGVELQILINAQFRLGRVCTDAVNGRLHLGNLLG